MPRFYDPQPFSADVAVSLSAAPAHHAARVLRLAVGDEVTLFNGEGGEWQVRLTQVDRKQVQAVPFHFEPSNRTPDTDATLWLPLIKGDRMDWAIQKATEMGVLRIRLYTSERTEVRLKKERLDKKLQHWQQVAISACEQCGMNRLPLIDPPAALSSLWSEAPNQLALIAQPGNSTLSLPASGAAAFTLLTGPEGGFSDSELAAANAAGFKAFSLGNRILRAETAPVALLGAIWALLAAH